MKHSIYSIFIILFNLSLVWGQNYQETTNSDGIVDPVALKNVLEDIYSRQENVIYRTEFTALKVSTSTIYDRGDPAAADLIETGMTMNNTWVDWDIAPSIAPNGVKAVLISAYFYDNTVNATLNFRKNGNSNTYNMATLRTQVSNIANDGLFWVFPDTNGVIEYRASEALSGVLITVCGWIK